jgi:hypothetical protein
MLKSHKNLFLAIIPSLLIISCVPSQQALYKGVDKDLENQGFKTSDEAVRDVKLVALPKDQALSYINTNFKFIDTSEKRAANFEKARLRLKKIDDIKKRFDRKEINLKQFLNEMKKVNSNIDPVKNTLETYSVEGTTDCKFDIDGVILYTQKLNQSNNTLVSLGEVKVAHNKLLYSVTEKNSIKAYGIFAVKFDKTTEEYLKASDTGGDTTVSMYSGSCGIRLKQDDDIKKFGTALHSLGQRLYTTERYIKQLHN